MAFDLIGPTEQASIDNCDELLFDVAELAGIRGPLTVRLWEEFYDGPSFTPEEALRLADEFKALLEVLRSKPELSLAAWEAPRRRIGTCARGRGPGILRRNVRS